MLVGGSTYEMLTVYGKPRQQFTNKEIIEKEYHV